ncbi:MAG: putative MarR family transcriptional regulator [Sphingomonas bacterium]|nr:putative MarR family transcriptional regulator [Sphingomonas bacterium]
MSIKRSVVHARLPPLLISARLSSELAYRRQLGLIELHRRLLSLIGNYDGLTSVELVALSGQEKAQISRAVKALTEAGLIERASLRARIQLSDAGRKAFEAIMALARVRTTALTDGIAADELAQFATMTARLIERAAMLLAEERQRSDALAAAAAPGEEGRPPLAEPPPLPDLARVPDASRPLSQMPIPQLITLSAYLQRSATIAYRRETNLSIFGWRVLSEIGENEPVTLARLISLIGRDKSQVGRAVHRLEADGAVVRQNVRGRRDILLSTTEMGARIFEEIRTEALRRDAYVFAGFSAAERGSYLATVDKLTANSEALLEREQASMSTDSD